jgi:arabinofuranosyltransferase
MKLFIPFRYAENIVEGKGFVFNPYEKVEVYSSFFWTLLLSFSERLNLDAIKFSYGIGLFLLSLNLIVFYGLSKNIYNLNISQFLRLLF